MQSLLAIVDKNPGQELGRYQEGFFLIKVRRPDGTDATFMIGVPVPTEMMCVMGKSVVFGPSSAHAARAVRRDCG